MGDGISHESSAGLPGAVRTVSNWPTGVINLKLHRKECRAAQQRAFTLRELLVVLFALIVLVLSVCPAWLRSSERIMLARCVSNLRQVGVAVMVYANESNQYLPVCKYSATVPWYTYEVARVDPLPQQLEQGYVNLGLLLRAKLLPDPQMIYCPAQRATAYTYDYYVSPGQGWFANPDGDDMVRAGYTYFPQVTSTQTIASGVVVSRVVTTSVALEYGIVTGVQPQRYEELNVRKSLVTDLAQNNATLAHRSRGVVAGLNALFPDGRVTFQSARQNPTNFSASIWNTLSSDGMTFRKVMDVWKP